ncbi:type I-E CRISPR-associated protein Cse2/CasB (plasmid) [Streptomyces sp. BB1-1-1]|uniref:type I-E CRISPR-associated protein Cse2/CasB n=1 Tax=Streptomyces sp. BB1-1-1 TaxID=3074430 RepID=UPI002877CCDB|nr:type I-E CRISPR-associated protein Cse2/CasB [Streptomyces sp. BB1-1-1]WND40009.1 type I-E CRISPR-associated protein Cse2/CasB [Streptomyces sp. BB1-1-1]WND40843.1 type I-E CRISPR-associated protein Cse2/CasB [Streptomyces sp. BB1-1-1]
MPTATEHRASCDAFVAHIHLLCAETGVRVRLSRGRGRPVEECAPMDRYLARRTAHRQGRRAYYTVASLIAMAGPQSHTPGVRPDHDPGPLSPEDDPTGLLVAPTQPAAEPDPAAWFARPNLGATLATAVHRAGHGAERTESLLHLLTRLSDDQLHRRLPAPVTRLLKDGITPDWGVLLHDLVQRPYRRDQVGLRWRDAFYLAAPEPRRT